VLNHELLIGGCVLVSAPVADVLALAKRLRLQMNQESWAGTVPSSRSNGETDDSGDPGVAGTGSACPEDGQFFLVVVRVSDVLVRLC